MGIRRTKLSLVLILILSIVFIISGCGAKAEEVSTLNLQILELNSQVSLKESEITTLTSENRMLKEKVEEAKPWFEMGEQERKEQEEQLIKAKTEAEAAAKAEAAAVEAARIKKVEAEKLAKEAEEKKGYETGITYDQLARNPDEYLLKKVKFKGKVIQVMEGDKEIQLRLTVNSDYKKVIYVAYNSNIVDSRVLEDDIITLYGYSLGLLTYQSTMGGNITIPSIIAEKINQIRGV